MATRGLKTLVKEKYSGDFGEAVRNARMLVQELELEKAKKLLKDNDGKIPYHRWYKGDKFNYSAYGMLKGKVTGYFKTEANRYGSGGRRIYTYYKAHESGFLVYINETMCKIGVTQGLSTPHKFQSSNKREWQMAYKKFLNTIN
jgi:hypothetical protein